MNSEKANDPVHLETREQAGARQLSPTANRNKMAIADILLPDLPDTARVLEIASGSGEHGVHMCQSRSDIIWQPSDPDASARASQGAWRADCAGQIKPPLNIDVTQPRWWQDVPSFDAIYCSNMIHIAPWTAALGLAQGAGQILQAGQKLYLYGPFLEGDDTAASNLAFDQSLKHRNPDWGVRNLTDVKHIFADVGFSQLTRFEMPKNNRLLIFSKTS